MWPLDRYPTVEIRDLREVYDYIIVGGGTAGCVLANRLSEDESVTVLLLERGKAAFSWASRVPLLSCDYQSDGARTSKITSQPQVHVASRTMDLVVGKALGGTSRINGMIYTRGLPAEYNAWSRNGQKGWSYDDLHPYFLKSEHALDKNPDNHSANGEWRNRSHAKRFFATVDSVIQAGEKLGFPFVKDINSSAYPVVANAKLHYIIDEHGRRSDTASAFLPRQLLAARSSHLHVCTGALVPQLIISSVADGSVSVTGVRVQGDNRAAKDISIAARREVIVCAGPFGSPQLLMLSGIGPREHLAAHGIAVQKNLQGVGSNLQDHIGVPILFNIPMKDSLMVLQRRPLVAVREFVKYLIDGSGMFLGPAHELSLFARSELLTTTSHNSVKESLQLDGHDPANIPDIEIMMIAWGKTDERTKSLGGYSLWAVPVRPLSRGTVRLKSRDPHDLPLCDPNLLADPKDRETLHAGMRLCLKLKAQMASDGYPITDFAVPQDTEASALDKHTEEWGQSIYHYTSSCRMAPEDDAKPGVVDDELRVHGIKGLRIADSSVFPNIISTHLQAATVVVGEKCAAMLKSSFGEMS